MGRFVSRASLLARILSADCKVSHDQLIRRSRAEPPPPPNTAYHPLISTIQEHFAGEKGIFGFVEVKCFIEFLSRTREDGLILSTTAALSFETKLPHVHKSRIPTQCFKSLYCELTFL